MRCTHCNRAAGRQAGAWIGRHVSADRLAGWPARALTVAKGVALPAERSTTSTGPSAAIKPERKQAMQGQCIFLREIVQTGGTRRCCRCLGMQQQASVLSSRLAPAIPALPPASTAYALQNTCSSAVAGLPGRHSRAISESLSSFLPWKKAVNSFMTAASCVSLHSTAHHSVRQVSAVLSWSQALEGSAGCNQPPDQQP